MPPLSVQNIPTTPQITSVNGSPTKAAFYQQIAAAPSTTPNSAFYNNPYGVSAQEIDGMQRATPYSAPTAPAAGSSGSTAPTYAQNFLAGLPGLISNVQSGATGATNDASSQLGGSITQYVNALKQSQIDIDQQNIQNELAKQQGTAGVLSMVQHGLQSGGVTLGNDNASNSSAAEALARAYGQEGRDAQSQVGDQYLQGQSAVQAAQKKQDLQAQSDIAAWGTQKSSLINQIVQNAQNNLNYIAQSAISAGDPNSVNAQQQADEIRAQATAALSALDQQLTGSQGIGGITAMTGDAAKAQANLEATGGTAAAAPFNYTTVGPAQVQGGPAAAQLPIYIAPAPKKTS